MIAALLFISSILLIGSICLDESSFRVLSLLDNNWEFAYSDIRRKLIIIIVIDLFPSLLSIVGIETTGYVSLAIMLVTTFSFFYLHEAVGDFSHPTIYLALEYVSLMLANLMGVLGAICYLVVMIGLSVCAWKTYPDLPSILVMAFNTVAAVTAILGQSISSPSTSFCWALAVFFSFSLARFVSTICLCKELDAF